MMATRATVLVVSLSFFGAERGLTPPYVFADIIPQAPFLWNVIFLLAGASTLVFGITFSVTAGRWSLVLLTAAMSSRALGLIGIAEPTPWTAVSIYTGFLAVVLWAWPRVLIEVDLEVLRRLHESDS